MKLAVVSSVFANYHLEHVLPLVARAGYDGIDLWGGRPHVFRSDLSPDRLRAIRAQAADLGLEIASVMPAFYRYPFSLTTNDERVRQDSLSYMRESIENAVQLGAKSVLVVPGRSLHGQDREDAWARMSDSLSAVAEVGATAGVSIGVEAVNHYVSDLVVNANDALRLIRPLARDNLGVVLDSGHIHLAGQTGVGEVHALGDLLYQVHLNDNDGLKHQGLVPGDGSFNYQPLLGALQETGFRGFLSVELSWDYSIDPEPHIATAARRVRRWMKQLSVA
ncbi:MAG TPA: sugar phosphate isomerase/epimerase family protein [Spirochaetia bacterium]|nr:sugar phosphate isomerase/epimerase family protein [Spirochaetia bacterium]